MKRIKDRRSLVVFLGRTEDAAQGNCETRKEQDLTSHTTCRFNSVWYILFTLWQVDPMILIQISGTKVL